MILKDSAFTRYVFFTSLVTTSIFYYSVLELYVMFFHGVKEYEDKFNAFVYGSMIETTCKNLENQTNGFEKTGFTDSEDCINHLKVLYYRVTLVTVQLSLLIQLHYCMVVYTHYKRAHLPKSRGGTAADLDEDSIEMPNAF